GLGYRARRADEILRRGVLQHKARRTGTERARKHLVIVEGRQNQHWRGAGGRLQVAGRLHAIHALHPYVHYDHGRVQRFDGTRHLGAVAAFADDRETILGIEDELQTGTHQRLIIDEQDVEHTIASILRALPGDLRHAVKWNNTLDQPADSVAVGRQAAVVQAGALPHPHDP